MAQLNTRRTFLRHGATAGALFGLGDLGFLSRLAPVSAADAKLDRRAVHLQPEIEPIVQLIEETPRDRLLEEVAARIHGGLSYRELLAGLLLAGVKNVAPRPSVGHKFHAVLVVNSAHLASLASPPEHRWLPIFWALDYYKSSEAQDVKENGDWVMQAVDEAAVPSAREAPKAFDAAMDAWDEQAADAAVVGLARSAGASAVYEHMFRYGMRDFRSIGHKAIYVANSLRTLNCIGWRHAEPVLRSLAYALLMHEGDNPRDRDAEADRPFRRNSDLAGKVRKDWLDGKADGGATRELLGTLRGGSQEAACDLVVEQLNRGVATQSIWDALHAGGAELLMRQPGIASLHAVTSTNALRFAYDTSGSERTRLLLMLQNAAFLPMFLSEMGGRGKVKELNIDELQAEAGQVESTPKVDEIFAKLGQDRGAAARMAMGRLTETGKAKELIDAARVLTFLKGNDAHDYKFSSAALEDYYNVSPGWRDKYLAASMFNLCSSTDPDNRLVERTRAALG
jgi:hypothetical protein